MQVIVLHVLFDFLHLPRPKWSSENQIAVFDLINALVIQSRRR
jgi:hypothetical protein